MVFFLLILTSSQPDNHKISDMKKLLTLLLAFATVVTASAGDGFLKGKILKIDSRDLIAERGGSSMSVTLSGISSSSSLSLLSVERALERAVEDDHIAMVYLNYDHFSAGMSAFEEIRGLLGKLSEAGKPVIAYGASLGNGSYYLASVADRVFLHPKGGGALTGLGSTQFYLKDLLDTLGVDVQLIRHGKYKSAGEMYVRNDISPENREQYETLLSSLWSGMVEEMAASRGKTPEAILSLVDSLGTGTADTWLENGLVDGLMYRDEMEQYLCHLFGTTDPEAVKTVSIKEYISDLKKGPSRKRIGVIYADGQIVRNGGGLVGEKLAAEIAKVRADSTVKAVVFRVNSPGGEVVAADMIRREIEMLRKEKPVVASYGAYAASGGYLISAACDRIFVDNATLTGSIGVFGLVPSLGGAIRKNLKVNPVSMGTNAHSTMGTGMKPLTSEEEAWYQKEIEGIYDDFVSIVAEGRDMEKEAVDSIAQGRVWAGKDALSLGLADERGTLLDAIAHAASLAGLEHYRIAVYPPKKTLKETLNTLSGNDDDRKDPLVDVKQLLSPGFNAIARMPYLTIDTAL